MSGRAVAREPRERSGAPGALPRDRVGGAGGVEPAGVRMLVRIGQAIGKPRGWERIVRALAPPARFAGSEPRRMQVSDGYTFPVDAGTLIGWTIRFFGTYEPEVRGQIRRWLREGDVAIDVGANVGWHTLLMGAIVGPRGRVFAFEPNPTTRARLERAIAENGFRHVSAEPFALSDRRGPAGFDAPPAGQLWDGTGRLTGAAAAPSRVECTTLDAFIAERRPGRVALVKIDVEGWEPAVLAGADAVVAADRPLILFEYDAAYIGRCGSTGGALVEWLRARGYELFNLPPRRAPMAADRLGRTSGNFMAVPW